MAFFKTNLIKEFVLKNYKKTIFIFAIISILNFISENSFAKNEVISNRFRKGFSLGLNFPVLGVYGAHTDWNNGSWGSSSYSPGTKTGFLIGGGLELGLGFSERHVFFLSAEVQGGNKPLYVERWSRDNPGFFDLVMGLRFYFNEGSSAYLAPRIGGGMVLEGDSDAGLLLHPHFIVGGAVGYEWRIGRKFALTPELRLDYMSLLPDYGGFNPAFKASVAVKASFTF